VWREKAYSDRWRAEETEREREERDAVERRLVDEKMALSTLRKELARFVALEEEWARLESMRAAAKNEQKEKEKLA